MAKDEGTKSNKDPLPPPSSIFGRPSTTPHNGSIVFKKLALTSLTWVNIFLAACHHPQFCETGNFRTGCHIGGTLVPYKPRNFCGDILIFMEWLPCFALVLAMAIKMPCPIFVFDG